MKNVFDAFQDPSMTHLSVSRAKQNLENVKCGVQLWLLCFAGAFYLGSKRNRGFVFYLKKKWKNETRILSRVRTCNISRLGTLMRHYA